jgi:hypothetical protein
MPRYLLCLRFALVVWLLGVGPASALCTSPSGLMTPAAPAVQVAASSSCSGRFQLAEGSSKSCTESCMSQCRDAEKSCSGAGCNAQFQICARRCVVSCGSR